MLIDPNTEKNDSSDMEQGLLLKNNLQEITNNNELLELVQTECQEHNFSPSGLVILYENMDHGNKAIHIPKNVYEKAPNQYVETVVYNDDLDSDVSDVSEIYSNEDISDVFMINKERIDLINIIPSFEKVLCHKYGNSTMDTTNISSEFNKNFIFNDSFLKEQLNIHNMSRCKYSESTVIPDSLLHYICCNRFEDNYDFYIDNVIKYVQNTIDQLKRISNGEYLSGKAREKWREIISVHKNDEYTSNSLVDYTNVSVPANYQLRQVKLTWDNKIHSEMDVRSLKRMFKKRIILQVPKLLCGSYELFSRYCKNGKKKDSKKTSYQKDKYIKDSNIDLILQLKLLKNANEISSISSVMVLKTLPSNNFETESHSVLEIKPNTEGKVKITEIPDEINDTVSKSISNLQNYDNIHVENHIEEEEINTIDECIEPYPIADELLYTIRRLNVHSPVLEECEDTLPKKKRSPCRVRIKSPYENRSQVIEDKKRRKLLEIRARRENKKTALNENHRITKPKYGKGAVMAQSSNSVTKLSITNKSFYNSIYGQAINATNKNYKKDIKKLNLDDPSVIDLHSNNEDSKEVILTPDNNDLKFINRSYYLDDADTEIMHLQNRTNSTDNKGSKETDILFGTNVSYDTDDFGDIHQLITEASASDISATDTATSIPQNIFAESSEGNNNTTVEATQRIVPPNTPKHKEQKVKNDKTISTSIECRQNIDKIYDLMNKNADAELYIGSSNRKVHKEEEIIEKNLTVSDSLSSISTNNEPLSNHLEQAPNKTINSNMATVIPKVTINPKHETCESNNKHKKVIKNTNKISENPLRAISRLLQDIDNVQKTRRKSANESRSSKKSVFSESRNNVRSILQSKQTNNNNALLQLEPHKLKILPQSSMYNSLKSSPRSQGEQPANKTYKKKATDIIDELRELKGEAIRGPSRRSRLDNLAQPKKVYAQTQQKQCESRYGKQFLTERQRLTTNYQLTNREVISPMNRQKRPSEILQKTKHTTEPPIEKNIKPKQLQKNGLGECDTKLPVYAKRPHFNKTNSVSESVNEKMIAMESYINKNFAKVPNLVHNEKSRAPLIPTCSDLDSVASSPSAGESSNIGKKLHLMIETVTKTNSMLTALTENRDSTMNYDDTNRLHKSDNSNFCIDVFEDKNIVTAVACIASKHSKSNEFNGDQHLLNYQLKNSDNELQKLENALFKQMSNGTFNKRLRLKSLTITPKQSTQQVLVLNSGDTDATITKPSLTQKINFSKSTISDIKVMHILSSASIKMFPIQVSTIECGLTNYPKMLSTTENNIVQIKNKSCNEPCVSKNIPKIENMCHKGFQCNINLKKTLEENKTNSLSLNKDQSTKTLSVDFNEKDSNTELITPVDGEIQQKVSTILLNGAENSSNTTSLDVLMRLLNEIKNISSCHANLVKCNNTINLSSEDKELEVIHNNAPIPENTPDISITNSISLNSLTSLKQAESQNYISMQNKDDPCTVKYNKFTADNGIVRQPHFDKEVTAGISQTDIKHAFTDVPSRSLIATANKSTELAIEHVNSSLHKVMDHPKVNQEIILYERTSDIFKSKNIEKYNPKNVIKNQNTEFNKIIKMKRDILVTIYSVLVLTVFAALTIPDLLSA